MDNSKNITRLEREIEERELKIGKLKESQKEFEVLPENYKLAEKIHDITCSWNHTDGCSWEYENWTDKLGGTRDRYIEKADRMLKKVPYEYAALTLDNI
jgi:hypothetical protein